MNGKITIGRVGFAEEGSLNIRVDRSSPLGNPYKIAVGTTRDQVCDAYRAHLAEAHPRDWKVRRAVKQIEDAVRAGRDVNLQCWCAPKRCHGEEIRAFILEGLARQPTGAKT